MNLSWIKKVYLYLVSLISLVILVIAAIMLINLVLKTWVFPKADQDLYTYCPAITENTPEGDVVTKPQDCSNQRSAQKQRDAAQALAMIIVASPVFFYHWKLARKEA